MDDQEIVYRDPRELRAYDANSRTHSDEQIELLRGSIREFGFTNPILLKGDGTTIGAGHARCQAALLEGMDRVPTIMLDGLTDAQWRAYVIADNQLAIKGAGWDEAALQAELAALSDVEFDLSILGFDYKELSVLLGEPATESDPEVVPDAPTTIVTRPGDVWLLGDHRLICGDSTDADVVTKCLNGVEPHLMVTDPPYGVEYDADWRNGAGKGSAGMAVGKVVNDDRADWREAWSLFPGEVIYVWHSGTRAHVVADSLLASGFEIRAQIVWNKDRLIISRGHYHPKHEPCFYAVRKGKTGHWSGDRKQSTVWDIAHRASETGHSTQKPVECMKRPIENNSSPGQAVYEPFSGSGTTIIACEMAERRCLAIEIDPSYCDVSVIRWERVTGRRARLDGQPHDGFEAVAAALAEIGQEGDDAEA